MPSNEILRRVQITGGSTYIISLPKNWVRRLGLKQGDYLTLTPLPDGSLKVRFRKESPKPFKTTMRVDPKLSPEASVREFIARYLVGYDLIEITFPEGTYKHRTAIKECMVKKMIGVEIIDEASDYVIVQCLAKPTELSVVNAIKRMTNITSHMLSDVVKCLGERNEEVLKEVTEREDTVDKFYLFIVRQLKSVALGLLLPSDVGLYDFREVLGFRLVVKSVERIADHVNRIAKIMLRMPTEALTYLENLREMGLKVVETYGNSVRSLLRRDINLGHRVVRGSREIGLKEEEAIGWIIRERLDIGVALPLRTILESFKRIADYSSDIAEIAINLAIENPIPVNY
ncbi:MAG: hypothetical protein B6U69_02745 [Thermofilum sp. ex4484_15]|nr:MAG: hypothetical protein B6U69_02745 [Thermofilum sp. ex4484_15]